MLSINTNYVIIKLSPIKVKEEQSMFIAPTKYRPLYSYPRIETYFNQKVIYNGRNFILTLVQGGRTPKDAVVIVNNGWTMKDPFCQPIKPMCQNAHVFGLYYKLSDPFISFPKNNRIKKLLQKNPEFFGCQGLLAAEKELEELVNTELCDKNVILVGFTKSANMLLNHSSYSSNVTIDAICPMFEGTFSTIPVIMKKEIPFIYPLVGWILSEHIVDEDISVNSEYLKKADYNMAEKMDVNVVISTLDAKVEHSIKDLCNPINFFFWMVSPIMDRTVKKHTTDDTNYKSNGFISFKSQFPPFAVKGKLITVWASMPMTLKHPEVCKMLQRQIDAKNNKG